MTNSIDPSALQSTQLTPELRQSRADIELTCMVIARIFARLRSKDPNTQVGACVHHRESGGLFLGYNGFNVGVPDFDALWQARQGTVPLPEAPETSATKYDLVVHAETNAIRKAMSALGRLRDCELFVTHFPCRACMKDAIIPSGLTRVVYADERHFDPVSAWLAQQAGVTVQALPGAGDLDARIAAVIG